MSDEARVRRRYFGTALLFQALAFGYLIVTRRFPKGHDTQSVFLLQYLFLSHASPGGAALWMPYLAHGVVGTWFANLQAGLLQNVLLLAGGVPEGTPMLPIFYAGLFLEDLILLLGVWRLGGRFYRAPAAQFFVALAALGGSMWISNLYWNHRLVYAVPLAAALLLEALESGSRGKLFLAATLGALQLTGNAPYIPVLSTLAILAFVAVFGIFHRRRLRASLPLWRPRPADLAWLSGTVVVAGAVVVSIVDGLGSFRQYHLGRNPDGSVPLDAYLTYAGGLNPLRYLDLLLGLTPSKDYSLYCGLCTLLFAGSAFVRRPGKALAAVTVCFLLLVFFSMGFLSFVGAAGYYGFYPLHYFRYISLASPLAKLFLILIAGFGVDAFARPTADAGAHRRRLAFALAALGLVTVQGLWLQLRGDDPTGPLESFLDRITDGLARRPLGMPFLHAALPGAAVLAVGLLCARSARLRPALLVPFVLLLQGADVFRWRLQILRDETVPLNDAQWAVQKVSAMPYLARRTPNDEGNERSRAFGREIFDAGINSGTTYDYCDAFLQRDPSWSRYFVTQWSAPVDQLLRAHAGRSLLPDSQIPPPLLTHDTPAPRTRPEAYAKLIGESRDKLQVFSAAHPALDATVAACLNSAEFRGDILFLSSREGGGPPLEAAALARDERMALAPKLLAFSADGLQVEVEVPGSEEPWLVYADSWDPHWTATLNGERVRVERANLAYKAVRLRPGRNVVDFRYRAPLRSACGAILGIVSLGALAWLSAQTLRTLGVWPARRE